MTFGGGVLFCSLQDVTQHVTSYPITSPTNIDSVVSQPREEIVGCVTEGLLLFGKTCSPTDKFDYLS